ncbi:MAG: class I SAM-dependent methyltransferase [Roseimicrobium sp.]
MNHREYSLMRQMEDTHWWYAVLHQTVAAELRACLEDEPGLSVLDAGCGTGGMMEALRRTCDALRVTGLDKSPTALAFARQRGFERLVEGSVDQLPFGPSAFDAVLSLDVLYFEGVDNLKAMAEFNRVLKPGGTIVLNLPAFPALRGAHDVALRGARRYRPGEAAGMLKASGFEVRLCHCWNLWLLLPILCWRHLSRWWLTTSKGAATSDLFALPARLNTVMSVLGRADMALCRRFGSRLGTSVLAVARKPFQ